MSPSIAVRKGGHSLLAVVERLVSHSGSGSGLANRAPEFVTGGDLTGLAINENTPVGTIVGTLRARDPEGQRVFYYMSGDSLSVDKNTGAVRLIKPLDRETESLLDLIITVTDEKTKSRPANTVSVQREIRVSDDNELSTSDNFVACK